MKIVNIILDVFVAPVPTGGAPDVLVVTQESGRDVHRLGKTNQTLIVITDAHIGYRERFRPSRDLLIRQFVLILGAWGIRVCRVETDRVPVTNVPDECSRVAPIIRMKVSAEREVPGMLAGGVNVTDYKISHDSISREASVKGLSSLIVEEVGDVSPQLNKFG